MHLHRQSILIESKWNLKKVNRNEFSTHGRILIESKWNLKSVNPLSNTSIISNINRIKVEFKAKYNEETDEVEYILIESKWNLKWNEHHWMKKRFFILIESKWNLKALYFQN